MSAMSTKRYMQEYSLQHYSYYPQTNKKTLKSRTDKLYHTIEYHIPVKKSLPLYKNVHKAHSHNAEGEEAKHKE